MGFCHGQPCIAFAEVAKGGLRDLNSKAFANTVWVFAIVSHTSPELEDATAEVAKGRLKDSKPHALANLVWAFTTASLASPVLLEASAEVAKGRLEVFDSDASRKTRAKECDCRSAEESFE